jgi:hypothetical protein
MVHHHVLVGNHGVGMASARFGGATDNGRGPDAKAEPPFLREVYPDLCTELIELLNVDGHTDLGICAYDLRIVAPCSCGDDFCQSFYTAPPPNGAYGPGHRNVPLFPKLGMLILDVVHGRIMFVEVLDRPPLRDQRVGAQPPGSSSEVIIDVTPQRTGRASRIP